MQENKDYGKDEEKLIVEEKPEECYSCGFPTTELKAYEPPPHRRGQEQAWFCKLCANTMAGNAYQYPGQYSEGPTLRTICFIGNLIIQAIKEKNAQN